MDRPKVSVIICTRDRAESLRGTLASLANTNVPADLTAELVVVDNGSSDSTRSVIERCRAAPDLPARRVSEPAAGLSRARNAGLQLTSSDVLLFTDDDVRVPADWIEGMCRPILSGDADAVAGGVRFPAEYESRLSEEPFRHRRGWLATTEEVDPVNPGKLIGANMAFSRRAAETMGGFDLELGAGALGFGEEILFADRLVEAGFRIRGALDTSVTHHFDLTRLTVPALNKMAERMGRSTAYIDYHWCQVNAGPARANARKARLLLAWERLLGPWRRLSKRQTWQTTQRVMTTAYWQQLAGYAGQPRRYFHPPKTV